MAREVGEALRDRRRDLPAQLGHVGEQGRELTGVDHRRDDVRHRDHARRAGPVVEEGDLADVGARPAGDDHLAVVAHLHLALEHHEELPPDLALGHEQARRRNSSRVARWVTSGELLRRQRGEQRHVGEGLLQVALRCGHGEILAARPRSPQPGLWALSGRRADP
ncbi:MAG: hypothetical protein U0W40_13905 [Acidimicrobiia bacterium]